MTAFQYHHLAGRYELLSRILADRLEQNVARLLPAWPGLNQ